MKYITTIGEREYSIEIVNRNLIIVDGVSYEVDFSSISGQPVYSLLIDGKSYEGYMYPDEDDWEVLLQGSMYAVNVEDERERRLTASRWEKGQPNLANSISKHPCLDWWFRILVNGGQEVSKGEVLVILELMKMQNELKSPRDGVISRLRVKEGDSVERKQTLLSVI